jgi:hypothetical protein
MMTRHIELMEHDVEKMVLLARAIFKFPTRLVGEA